MFGFKAGPRPPVCRKASKSDDTLFLRPTHEGPLWAFSFVVRLSCSANLMGSDSLEASIRSDSMNFYVVGFYPKRTHLKKGLSYFTVSVVASDVEEAKQVAHIAVMAENPAFDANAFDVDVSAPIRC